MSNVVQLVDGTRLSHERCKKCSIMERFCIVASNYLGMTRAVNCVFLARTGLYTACSTNMSVLYQQVELSLLLEQVTNANVIVE